MSGARPDRPEIPLPLNEAGHGELMDNELWSLVNECWSGDKDRRPTAIQAHRRLVDMDLSNLLKRQRLR